MCDKHTQVSMSNRLGAQTRQSRYFCQIVKFCMAAPTPERNDVNQDRIQNIKPIPPTITAH